MDLLNTKLREAIGLLDVSGIRAAHLELVARAKLIRDRGKS
jgi:hypothetical protein